MDSERPRIKLIPTQTDKFLDRLAIAGLIFLWVYTLTSYFYLPAIIPNHRNSQGQISDYMSKETIIIVPCILTTLAIGITILNHYPHIFNYPQKLTKDSAEQQYSLATTMMRYLKLAVVILAIAITVETATDAQKERSGVGMWDIPLIIILMGLPTAIYLIQSYKLKKHHKRQDE